MQLYKNPNKNALKNGKIPIKSTFKNAEISRKCIFGKKRHKKPNKKELFKKHNKIPIKFNFLEKKTLLFIIYNQIFKARKKVHVFDVPKHID